MKTQYSKSDIQVFIFNWKDYYKKTCHIESSLKKIISDVSIINTNDSNFSEHWINIGEEHYFSGQMRAMLKHHNPEKIVLIILADIQFENWEGLISDAIKYSDQYNWGIYTPEIDFTPHKTNKVSLPYHRYLDHNLRAVSCSDGLVWFIHPYILMQFKQRSYDQLFDQSIYGWGWDHILNSLCYILKKPVISLLNFEHNRYNHFLDIFLLIFLRFFCQYSYFPKHFLLYNQNLGLDV